ncbi:BT_3987 domain-containing protein [uncultured Fibrella sp.]|uniref:BT_3987 domain-containing protein n=1 Tax=uncultured Fibrella sp. TaxID=1284596 RepID=UPI0035CA6B50
MKNYLSLCLAATIALSMTSCLKDDEHFVDFTATAPVIDIPTSAFYGVVANQGLSIQTAPVSYSFNVNLSGPQTLGQDVTVNLAIDPSVLTAYNAANSTNYKPLPSSLYQFTTTTTTIKAGQRLAPVSLNFFSGSDKITDQVGYNNANYALPIRVTGTSNNLAVSSNFGYKIISLKLKNQYDGTYGATGTFTHPVNGPRAINEEKTLQTIDLNTVQTNFADLGNQGWLMQLRVNADNTVTLIPKGSANAATIQFGVNKYDPATKTYTLNYKYAGSGGDRVINETLRRK